MVLLLEWLRIWKFRWVEPETTLHFREGINAIIGRNGTGKTTLLDLLAVIWSSDFSALEEEEFDVEYRFSAGAGSVEVRLQNRQVETSEMSSIPGLPPMGPQFAWEYTLRMTDGQRPLTVRVALVGQEIKVDLSDYVESDGVVGRWEPSEELRRIQPKMLDLFRGGLAVARWNALLAIYAEFVEDGKGGVTFSGLDSFPILPLWKKNNPPLRYPEGTEWVAQVVEKASFWGFSGEPGADIAPLVSRALPAEVRAALANRISDKSPLPGTISLSAEDEVPFLQRAAEALGVQAISLTFQLSQGELKNGARPFSYRLAAISFTKPDGVVLGSLDQLSHGQRRLFGFLWYLGCSGEVAIADELSNGMHWGMTELALEALGERQAFLAMQDPLLLDHLEFTSAEEVRRGFVCCRTVQAPDGAERWAWAPFSPEASEDFFASYSGGFRHVSEILRTRGLW